MPCDGGHIFSCDRITKYCERRTGFVPVVIPIPDLCANSALRKKRTNEVANDGGALRRRQTHPRIIVGLEMRLVLKRDCEDRQTFSAIRFDPSTEVVSKCGVELRYERTLDETARSLHPPGWAPWTSHQFEFRIYRERGL